MILFPRTASEHPIALASRSSWSIVRAFLEMSQRQAVP
jgi:hypothetical protein